MPGAVATAVAATATDPPLQLPALATRRRLRAAAQRRHVILVAVLLVGRPGGAVAAPPAGEQAPTPWDLEDTDVGSLLQIRAYNEEIRAYDDYFGRSEQLLSAIEADLGVAAPSPPPGWPGPGAAAAGAYAAPDSRFVSAALGADGAFPDAPPPLAAVAWPALPIANLRGAGGGDAAAPFLRRPQLKGLAAPDAASPAQPADIQTIAREAALSAIEATIAKHREILDPESSYTTMTTTTHFLDGITRSHWFPYAFVAFAILVVLPLSCIILTQCSATDLLLLAAVT